MDNEGFNAPDLNDESDPKVLVLLRYTNTTDPNLEGIRLHHVGPANRVSTTSAGTCS
jgi:hypothetical protein